MPDLFDDILPVVPPRGTRGNSWGRLLEEKMTLHDEATIRQLATLMKIPFAEDVVLELIRRAASPPNGSAGYEAQCFGCGKKFHVKRRPIPGRHSWCDDCKASGEPAAQRAREYRERRSKIAT
jgi:hypothetical protein